MGIKITYKVGVCSCHGLERTITQKSKNLCAIGQAEMYRSNSKPKSPAKPLIRKPLIKKAYVIKKQSKAGKIRKDLDVDFYHKMWEKSQDWKGGNVCEECRVYLPSYKSNYISHILSRGAFPEFAHRPENHNILCSGLGYRDCHGKWETGDKSSMAIFEKNQKTIEALRAPYPENFGR